MNYNDDDIIKSEISWHELFMRQVYVVARKSKDPRTKIGAVLVKDNRIIATGYNGFPSGVLDLKIRYDQREVKYQYVVHGEHNAILSCARIGVSSVGSSLYTQGYPCNECCKAIIQGGVSEVIIHKQWPVMSSPKWKESHIISCNMLSEAQVRVIIFDKVLHLLGKLDDEIISV